VGLILHPKGHWSRSCCSNFSILMPSPHFVTRTHAVECWPDGARSR